MSLKPDNAQTHILIVDDESTICNSVAMVLVQDNCMTTETDSVESALQLLESNSFDLVITGLNPGNRSGLDIISEVRECHPETETMLITAADSDNQGVAAMQAGALDYITMPFSDDQLLLKVRNIIKQRNLKEELTTLRQHVAMNYGFDNIVGISKEIGQLKETAQRIAPTDITTLITGASGTGKELFARTIHHHSERRKANFVTIDFSTIPEPMMDSELFGQLITSANSTTYKKGLLEEANGGTVFLDEVSNMPMTTQAKMLRCLQNSEIQPVGSDKPVKIDIRIIAATNQDLARMVDQKQFREDLFYKLNVIPLNLPLLTERAEDIDILTEYFLRRIGAEMSKPSLSISRQAVESLQHHTWPGNVRELENTIKRGAALCAGDRLEADDILFITSDRKPELQAPTPTKSTLTIKSGLLDDNQRTLIIKALDSNSWNYTRTAAELGIGRTTLWRKIKKYNLKNELVES